MSDANSMEELFPLCSAAGLDGNKFTETHLDQLLLSWGIVTKSKAIRIKQIKFKLMLIRGEPIPHNQAPICLLLEDLPDERWAPITPADTTYMVSTYGRIKSYKYINTKFFHSIIVTPEIRKGYYSVDLREFNDTVHHRHFDIHRLVAEAFIPKREIDIILNRNVVNHIDGDTLNPYYTNLEWVTSSENRLHGIRSSIIKGNSLTEEQLHVIRNLHTSGFTIEEISAMNKDIIDLDTSTVDKVIHYYDYKVEK